MSVGVLGVFFKDDLVSFECDLADKCRLSEERFECAVVRDVGIDDGIAGRFAGFIGNQGIEPVVRGILAAVNVEQRRGGLAIPKKLTAPAVLFLP